VLLIQHRGKGKGESLIKTMLKDIKASFVDFKIVLSAQTSAVKFYHPLGFIEFGEPYDDGGIEHISMLHSSTK
jgi:ElaA protein